MWRLLFFLFIIGVYSNSSLSQTYGNEWIEYDQQYYSFKVFATGIYRLDYATMQASGIPLSSFSSENIQLFGREREVPLYIQDGGDSSIDPGDYILFYAQKNDGWLDSTLYEDPNLIGNPGYSIYNDTIHYFFTWNNSTNNLRYQQETATDFSNYSSSNFIIQKIASSYTGYYNLGGDRITHASSTFFKGGEGFGLAQVDGIASTYTPLTLSALTYSPYLGSDAPLPVFQGLSTTNSSANYTGSGNHHLRWLIGTSNHVLFDQTYIDFEFAKVDQSFPISVLSNGATPLKWTIVNDQAAVTDYQQLNYWSITYPRMPNLDGASTAYFKVKNATGQTKIRLDLTGLSYNNSVILIQGDVPKMGVLSSYNGGYSTLFTNSTNGVDQDVFISPLSSAISIASFEAVNGSGSFTDFSSMSAEGSLIMIYHPSLISATNEYKNYRQSVAGGSYTTLMANIEELYLQYGGGIPKHINSVRRFAHQIFNQSTEKPVGLFLLGKAVSLGGFSVYGTPGSRTNVSSYTKNLIPTFGEPPSDGAITANLNGNHWAPLIPTGRIAVLNDQQMLDYLNKVKEYEIQQDPNSFYNTAEKDWQKQILHLGGGINASQQSTFQNYLNSMKNTIEGADFGGNVQSIFKNSSAPIDPTVLTAATDRIQSGISILNFFGHATNAGFDINIDHPEDWHNQGKYPIVIANSCLLGNMYANFDGNNFATTSGTERYVNIPNGGAIAFIGIDNDGLDQPLSIYSNELYRQFSGVNYGQTLGSQIKSTVESLQASGFTSLYIETTCQQMNLDGDPMIRLNWHQKPEIELTVDRVSFLPTELDLTVDSIEVNILLTNLGRAITDTFDLEITRNFPLSPVDSIYTIRVPHLYYQNLVKFKFPMQENIGVGINSISIAADIPSMIDEQYDEIDNNRIITTLFVDIDGILPVLPSDFAVVPDPNVTVKGSTVNPIADYNTYRFEIDTTDLFNSPQWRYATVSGLGGVKEVDPSQWKSVSTNQGAPLLCTDSTVYFWRVALEASPYEWRERSFQYIPDRSGWGQDHFFQFKQNGFSGINYNRAIREREFMPQLPDTLVVQGGNGWFIKNQYTLLDYNEWNFCTGSAALNVVVIDNKTHKIWGTSFGTANSDHHFGNQNDNGACSNRIMYKFTYPQTTTAYMDAFRNLVDNVVPDSFYILIYTQFKGKFNDWTNQWPEVYTSFSNLGSTDIVPGIPDLPFAFFCQKGNPASAVEDLCISTTDTFNLKIVLDKILLQGQENSTMIGPASKWGNVYWKQDPMENPSEDSTELHIKVYDLYQAFQYQIDTLFTRNDSIMDLSTAVNANLFPYISLTADYSDTTTTTPAQIDRWHVLFDPLPEAAIDGSTQYTWLPVKDTLDEGEIVKFAVDVKNIFTIPMDSILIRYWLEDASHQILPIPYTRQDSLRVGGVIRDTVEFSTMGLVGVNSFWMEVNPYVNGSLYITDQPEQEHFNNLLQVPFHVRGDDVNPILDVTFDGRHILNNDIVSPFSEVLITLKDDNPLLLMDDISDTTLFGIYLTDPLGVQRRIPFIDAAGNTIMQWIPAEASNKKFKIIYPGNFEQDGKYSLLIQGADRSGNLSGDLQYRITFEVIHESTITYLMNYPNPFSTSTRFVFTLTGSEVPEDMIIQIMTVTGRVVREITESEIGPVYIGRNITQFDWNGTDEFGDPLANGVYLYRVKAQINGEDIKHRDTGADTYFTKDFGKMYIMR